MRVLVTGGAGFVGSNVVAVAADRTHEVAALTRATPARAEERCTYVTIDLLDAPAVRAAVRVIRPEAIVHTAILNDMRRIWNDRELAWKAYVDVTRTLADAANEVGAALVTVSTDWVFDGTQAPASESTPPNPINLYGVLKVASELVTLERARVPLVTRIAGVMGVHRARADLPRTQDAGFGYFVESVVSALERGEPFTVWESNHINMAATPSLASASAHLMLDLVERGLQGIFHCCGEEAATRLGLARAAADAFGLDTSLLESGAPDPALLPPAPVPYDTRLDASATAAALEVQLPDLRTLLERFRAEREQASQ